jgi:hypothetical protein
MVERDDRKPRNKAAAFDVRRQRQDGVSRNSPELTDAEKRAFLVEFAGIRIEQLNVILSMSPYIKERQKILYYKFHTAVTLVGINPNYLLYDPQHKLKRTRKQLQIENEIKHRGAKRAAYDCLKVDPDNLAAQTILEQGVYAPLWAHQDFSEAVEADIWRLYEKYYPRALTDSDPQDGE